MFEVDKKIVARRQLNTAIRLFFNQDCAISIHTLVMASNQVLRDISPKNNLNNSLYHNEICDSFQHEKDKYKFINFFKNYFKHADQKEPDIIYFNSKLNEFILFDTVLLHFRLENKNTPETLSFIVWFIVKYPKFISFTKEIQEMGKLRDALADISYKACLDYINILKSFPKSDNLIYDDI